MTDGWFVFYFQVVEANLVAFDCHWIIINEVTVSGECESCFHSHWEHSRQP